MVCCCAYLALLFHFKGHAGARPYAMHRLSSGQWYGNDEQNKNPGGQKKVIFHLLSHDCFCIFRFY